MYYVKTVKHYQLDLNDRIAHYLELMLYNTGC